MYVVFIAVFLLNLCNSSNLYAQEGLQAIIFDWAGTILDYGCQAPALSFKKIFNNEGIEVSEEEVRAPMGLEKKEHIAQMLENPSIERRWLDKYGEKPKLEDVERLYLAFIPAQMQILNDYSLLIPGALETSQWIQEKGWLIGSSTGYNKEMLDLSSKKAAEQGFKVHSMVSADMVSQGRPAPDMIKKNCEILKVESFRTVKVDDSIHGIIAGHHAGCWTIYVYQTSSDLGKSEIELKEMSEEEREELCSKVKEKGAKYAHYSIASIAQLPDYLEMIDKLISLGYSSKDFSSANPAPIPEKEKNRAKNFVDIREENKEKSFS